MQLGHCRPSACCCVMALQSISQTYSNRQKEGYDTSTIPVNDIVKDILESCSFASRGE